MNRAVNLSLQVSRLYLAGEIEAAEELERVCIRNNYPIRFDDITFLELTA